MRSGARPAATGALVVLAAWAATFSPGALAVEPAGDAVHAVLKVAPDFSRPALDQRAIRLSDFRGKVVLLNFWASWCGPCLEEMPQFAQWQRSYAQRGLQVIGISMDDEAAPVQAAYKKLQLNYPVVMGDEQLADQYGGIYGLPVTLLIDRQGQIKSRQQGATDLNAMKREIEGLLGSP